MLESGKIFRQIGEYIPLAIGDQSGNLTASVLKNPDDIFNYSDEKVQTISLRNFISEFMGNISLIHFLFLDGEGVEYKLLPYLESEFLKSLTFCQISVELHGPVEKYGLGSQTDFDFLMRKFIENSTYLPIWMPATAVHSRMFMIDVKSSRCIEQFFRRWC